MAEEKRVFTPTGVDELIKGWLIHAHKSRDRHDEAARLYAKAQYALGIPSLVASTVVGSSVVAALASNAMPPWWVGLLSLLAAVLAALQTFMDYGGRSDKHRGAAVRYKAAIRQLEQLRVRRIDHEEVHREELDQLRASLDALEDTAPVVMPSIYDRVEKKYRDVKYVEEALELYAT
jgi:hypothetical protein